MFKPMPIKVSNLAQNKKPGVATDFKANLLFPFYEHSSVGQCYFLFTVIRGFFSELNTKLR